MKTIYLYFALFSSALSVSGQTILLQDNFNNNFINSSSWNQSLPFGSSSLVEADGNLATTGRGALYTVDGFNAPYIISGQFTLNDGLEHFNIMFRSDFSIFPPLSGTVERNGVFVSFSNDGDQISIQRLDPAFPDQSSILTVESYPLAAGVSYTFSITDTGSLVSLSINGVPEISASTPYSSGNQIGFYSREFSDSSTSVDSFQVSTVPEPGFYGLILGVPGLIISFWFRKFHKKSVFTSP